MSIEGQGHFFTIYFPGFVCFVLYWAKISGERLQDHWSSGFNMRFQNIFSRNIEKIPKFLPKHFLCEMQCMGETESVSYALLCCTSVFAISHTTEYILCNVL